MKRSLSVLAVILVLVMLVASLPVFAANEFGEPLSTYDDYGYYAYFDFENYGNATNHHVYMRGEYYSSGVVAKNADGKECDPFGFLLNAHGNTEGSGTLVTESNGNHYYSFKQSGTINYGVIATFEMQRGINNKNLIIGDSAEISLRFRMHEEQTESATALMPLISIRRGATAGLAAHVYTDIKGNVYARVSSKNQLVYTNPADNDDFIEVAFRWFDTSNTYSLYVNGVLVAEGIPLEKNYRSGDYVTTTYNDDFMVSSRTFNGSVTEANARAIEVCRRAGSPCCFNFDIDDIMLKRVETAQRGAIYYENDFDAVVDGLSLFKSGTSVYSNTIDSSTATLVTEADGNKYLEVNTGKYFSLNDTAYKAYVQNSFVIQAKIKAKPTHTDGFKSLIAVDSGINYFGILYTDPAGNIYLEDNASRIVYGYKLDGTEWLDITAVLTKNNDNAGKFGSFFASNTTSSKNCSYYISCYINGEYVGTTKDRTVYEWKITDSAAGTGKTASGKQITVTHSNDTLDLAALGITSANIVADGLNNKNSKGEGVGSTTDHIIYKLVSSSGVPTYYDVLYTSDGASQLGYSVMTIGDSTSDTHRLRFFAGATYNGAIDNIRVYEGTSPEWFYENVNSEKGGEIVNANFGFIGASSNDPVAQTATSGSAPIYGTVQTSGFTSGKLVRKDANGNAITAETARLADYATVQFANSKAAENGSGNWYDFFVPVPRAVNGVTEVEYSYETTIKNIQMTPGTTDRSGQIHLFRTRLETTQAYTSVDLMSIDSSLRLWAGDYTGTGADNRIGLYHEDGTPVVLDNNSWNTVRTDIYICKTDSACDSKVSFYYNDELLYLEDGSLAYHMDLSLITTVYDKYFGTTNFRLRYTQALLGDAFYMDIKSIKISANNIEKPVYSEEASDISFNEKVVAFELSLPKYVKEDSYGFYDVVKLTKGSQIDGLIAANVNSGRLAIRSNGKYFELYDKAGNAITLGDTPLDVAIVYDDIAGRARYYVNGTIAFVSDGTELVEAVDMTTSGFATLSTSLKSSYALFEGYASDEMKVDSDSYELNSFAINNKDTAELIGFQENSISNGIRVIAGVDGLYYSKVGFEVEIFEGGVSAGVKDVSSTLVFDSVTANDKTITAESVGYDYLATLNIVDLPENISNDSYVIVRSYSDIAGEKHYDSYAKILVTDEGYEFGVTSDKDIYDKKQAVLLIGQSNMAGRGDLSIVEAISDERITMMRDLAWVPMTEPIHTDKPTIAGAGLAASFAKAFVETFDCEVGLIPAAFGGSSLADWAVGADLYENAIAMAKKAQEDSEICAILWHQGESNETDAKYAEKFEAILEGFIEELGLDRDKIIIVTGELGKFRGDRAENVSNQLASLTSKFPNYAVATSEGLLAQDVTTHFDAPSLRVFGYRYFAHFYKMLTGKTYEFIDDPEYYRVTPEEDDSIDMNVYVSNNNFEAIEKGTEYTTYTRVGGICFAAGGGSAKINELPGSSGNNYVVFTKSTAGSEPYIDIDTKYLPGEAIVTEARFMIGAGFEASADLLKLVQTSPSIASMPLLYVGSNGALYDKVNSVIGAPYNVTLSEHEWTYVKIIAYPKTNTKDVYINGMLYAEGAQLASSADLAKSFVPSLTRVVQFAGNQKTGSLHIDAFKSYHYAVTAVNFSDLTVGTNYNSTTVGNVKFSTNTTSPVTVHQTNDASNTYVSITCGAQGSSPYIDITNKCVTGADVTVEAKFMLKEGSACQGDLLKLLDPSASTIALVHLNAEGYLCDIVKSTVKDSFGVQLSSTAWTTVKVVCHLSENTKDVYINGNLVASGITLYNSSVSNYTPDRTRIMQYKSSGLGTVYFDDFICYN